VAAWFLPEHVGGAYVDHAEDAHQHDLIGQVRTAVTGMAEGWAGWINGRMVQPQSPKRGTTAVRILLWVVAGVVLGVALCCGGLFLAGTVPLNAYR
jgi:hypothetical protein